MNSLSLKEKENALTEVHNFILFLSINIHIFL